MNKQNNQSEAAHRKIIAVDFDGTLCVNAYPDIGEPIKPVINYVKKEQENGAIIVLWTCRQGQYLTAAVEWCAKQGVIFDHINENTSHNVEKYGNNPRKVFADVYIDDKAMSPIALYSGGGTTHKEIR